MAKARDKSRSAKADNSPTIENRKARFDYAILDTLETGMVLTGSEVKSIRDGKASLAEGYVRVELGLVGGRPVSAGRGPKVGPDARAGRRIRPIEPGLWLHSVNIAEYPPAGPSGSVGQHNPTRTRKLLAHKREIAKLAREVAVKGMTLVPLKIYFKNGRAKLLIGLAQGKSHQDKRQAIAKRESDRDIQRAMSRRV
ncbi:MAG: SsrA-binding protein [Phycisphaerales bacterium]